MTSLGRILHATDFETGGAVAFAHALRLALDAKARLYLVHVRKDNDDGTHWTKYPHVRQMLGRWGLIDPRQPPRALESQLGLHVAKVSVDASDPRGGLARFAKEHACDLLVMSTHDRGGLRRWIESSVAEDVARSVRLPTLFVPEGNTGFVDADTGKVKLDTALVPVDAVPDYAEALEQIVAILRPMAPQARIRLMHVGRRAPARPENGGADVEFPIDLRQGPVVETILATAKDYGAGLIAMPTSGRHGLLEAMRGSTTERVLRQADLPLLAVPVATG